MALPNSGNPISLNQVNVELGYSGTQSITMNDSAVRTLFGKASGAISMSDGYGKSNIPTPTSVTVNNVGAYSAVANVSYSGSAFNSYNIRIYDASSGGNLLYTASIGDGTTWNRAAYGLADIIVPGLSASTSYTVYACFYDSSANAEGARVASSSFTTASVQNAATGGDLVKYVGNYAYHIFTTSSTGGGTPFRITNRNYSSAPFKWWITSGGGGGDNGFMNGGSGGGGGGTYAWLHVGAINDNYLAVNTDYNVTIGAGSGPSGGNNNTSWAGGNAIHPYGAGTNGVACSGGAPGANNYPSGDNGGNGISRDSQYIGTNSWSTTGNWWGMLNSTSYALSQPSWFSVHDVTGGGGGGGGGGDSGGSGGTGAGGGGNGGGGGGTNGNGSDGSAGAAGTGAGGGGGGGGGTAQDFDTYGGSGGYGGGGVLVISYKYCNN